MYTTVPISVQYDYFFKVLGDIFVYKKYSENS